PCANRNVKVNDYNLVDVQTLGGVHRLFINGALACTATDYTYGTGRVGFATFVNPVTTGFGADFFNITPAEVVRDGDEMPEFGEPDAEIVSDAGPVPSVHHVPGTSVTPLTRYLDGAQ